MIVFAMTNDRFNRTTMLEQPLEGIGQLVSPCDNYFNGWWMISAASESLCLSGLASV
jgi:hypothetical protein